MQKSKPILFVKFGKQMMLATPPLLLGGGALAAGPCPSPTVHQAIWTQDMQNCDQVSGGSGAYLWGGSDLGSLKAYGNNVYDNGAVGAATIIKAEGRSNQAVGTTLKMNGPQTIHAGPATTGIDIHSEGFSSGASLNLSGADADGDAASLNLTMSNTSGPGITGLNVRSDSGDNTASAQIDGAAVIHVTGAPVSSNLGAASYATLPAAIRNTGLLAGTGALQLTSNGVGLSVEGGYVQFDGDPSDRSTISADVTGIFLATAANGNDDATVGRLKHIDVTLNNFAYDHGTDPFNTNTGVLDQVIYAGIAIYGQRTNLADISVTTYGSYARGIVARSDNEPGMFTNILGADVDIKGSDSIGIQASFGFITLSKITITGEAARTKGLWVDNYFHNVNDAFSTDDGRSVTLNSSQGANVITLNGSDSVGMLVDGGGDAGATVTVSDTTINMNGANSQGLVLSKGKFTALGNFSIVTAAQGADGIVYKPDETTVGNVPLVVNLDATTSVTTSGDNSNALVVDGSGGATAGAHFAITGAAGTGASMLDNFRVSGQGSAVLLARNGGTITLDGSHLSRTTAQLNSSGAADPASWGAVAIGSAATDPAITFKNGASTGGTGVWASDHNGLGSTIEFTDTASASGSLIKVDTRSTLKLDGMSSAFHLGRLQGNGTVTINANGLVFDGAAGDAATFSGTLTGAGGLTVSGAGTQTLAGPNALGYSGATHLNGGTLAVAAGIDATSRVFNFNGGTLDISQNGGTFNLGQIVGSGTVDTGTTVSSDLVLHGAGQASFSGTIEGSGGLELAAGSSQTLTLSGSHVFDYTGQTVINSGTTLSVANGAVGRDATGNWKAFTFGGSPADTGGTLDISGNGGRFALGGLAAAATATTATIQLGHTSPTATDLQLSGTGTYSFGGRIQGYGNLYLGAADGNGGTGTQILSGDAAFGFNGNTILNGGVLAIRNIADPSSFNHTVVLNGGWLDLSDSSSQSINDWRQLHIEEGANAGRGGVIGANDRITLGQNGADETRAEHIGGDGTDPGQQGIYVVKTGSNTETLTGRNYYAGNTRIEDGWLRVSQDANLGNIQLAREVILDSGNANSGLQISGSFDSGRQLQLARSAGTVKVDAGINSTWNSVVGVNNAYNRLIKQGEGTLGFSGQSYLGSADVQAGTLNLGQATVDTTASSNASDPAITMAPGTTVSVDGGSVTSEGNAIVTNGASALKLNNSQVSAGGAAITMAAGTTAELSGSSLTSQGDAIVANGSSTVNLSNTQINAGGASYRVTAGTGTLNANAQTLAGNVLEADGSGSRLALNLANQSVYTGVPTLRGGATAALSIDQSSTWNLTGDATLSGLSNQGSINFGAASPGLQTQAVTGSVYQTLTVDGDYAGGGTLAMRTVLNAGGAVANQQADRLLVRGNASGTTTIALTASGTGGGTELANTPISSTGISLVQVQGQSTPDAFQLAKGYVAVGAYQYRLFGYGPGSAYGTPSQSLLPGGQMPQWDYRLQTTCVDLTGVMLPAGLCQNANGRTTLVPQASSYLTAPLALQNYESIIMDSLVRRLGDVRRDRYAGPGDTAEMFIRSINNRSSYAPDLGFSSYQYRFNQNVYALQVGGNWLRLAGEDQELRLGAAVTMGSTSLDPKAPAGEGSRTSFDTRNVALTATWQRADGWYVDAVLAGGYYKGTVRTDASGRAGDIVANGRNLSLAVGRAIPLAQGFEIEPYAQVFGQSLNFSGRRDADGVDARPANVRAWTGRVGARFAMPLASTLSWTPYARVSYQRTWMNTADSQVADQSFGLAQPGSSVQLGVGASGAINRNFSLYGEVSGQARVGGYGFSGIEGTVGIRYRF